MPPETKPRLVRPPEEQPQLAPGSVAQQPDVPLDRLQMTTIEEQKIYDDMLEKDFIKIDPKTRKPESVSVFYKVLHVYPRYLSSNPLEYRARFFIEVFEYIMSSDGSKKRQVKTSFDAFADEFRQNYIPTITESIASSARVEA